MFVHYLKIAFRNLLKYKTQTIVSIAGLAIGFTAFAFTMSWIRYEMSYDSFNPHADRIYRIERANPSETGNRYTSVGLTVYLRNNFPEVAAASNTSSSQIILPKDAPQSEWNRFIQDCRFIVYTDTAFFSVFYPDVKIDFSNVLPDNASVFSRSIAEKWNITPQKFGQKIDSLDLTPIAIFEDKQLPSNIAFGWMNISIPDNSYDMQKLWGYFSGYTYIRLHKGTTIDRIEEALDSLHVITSYGEEIRSYKVYPLRKVHYLAPNDQTNIKFEALKQFSVIALLVIICALINYIMLFVSRIKIRRRELALNKVNGASDKEILLLLFYEFLMTLLAAIFVGGLLTEWLFPAFSRFSMIVAQKSYFLVSVFWYSLIVIIVSTLTTFVMIYGFVRQTIRENISPEKKLRHSIKINFSHIAIFVQLFIGVLLIFSMTVAFNQYHLMDQRVGYNRNKLMIFATNDDKIPVSEFRKIPGVGNFIINSESFFTQERNEKARPVEIIDENQRAEKHNIVIRYVSTDFRDFLHIPLLDGRDMLPSENNAYFINETGNKELGNNAIGKMIYRAPIIGVIPDLQVSNPLVRIQPTLYRLSREDYNQLARSVTFRCENDSIKKRVHNWFTKTFPATQVNKSTYHMGYHTMDIDEFFKEFTKSERNLLMLIGIMTAVAILIAVFGIYSMITLACSQRRKEIAIRKVNGAKVKEILMLFFRQYFAVTVAACMVAFPVGVYVMQRWLEQYTRRVSMEWWLFAGVFVLVVAIVFASIIFRVWKAANENPADVVKSE